MVCSADEPLKREFVRSIHNSSLTAALYTAIRMAHPAVHLLTCRTPEAIRTQNMQSLVAERKAAEVNSTALA